METAVTAVRSGSTNGSLELSLSNARSAAQLRQRRLQVPCITGAVVFFCTSVVLRMLLTYGRGVLPLEATPFIHFLTVMSAVLVLLAMLPTQEKGIRCSTLALSAIMFLIAVLVVYRDMLNLRDHRLSERHRQGDPMWYIDLNVAISSVAWLTIGLSCSLRFFLLWRRRETGRRHLEIAWRIIAQTSLAFAFCDLGTFVLMVACGRESPNVYWTELGSCAARSLVAAFCWSPTARTKLQSLLVERGEQATAALVVGALLGDRPLPELMGMARERFRCISLDRVTKAMIEDNKPNAELHALTERRALGDVDAFVSHSWHDDPDEKWEALQRWRAEFKLTMGREARIWFDKFSIDQKNIADSLAGLPIYLAGCSKLLVLMGGTYVTRLWCLVELFAFIVMGGERAQLQIETLPSCKKGLSSLNVQEAKCFVEEDESRLLGIIEAGLGSLESFNHEVHVLAEHCEPLLRATSPRADAASDCDCLQPPFPVLVGRSGAREEARDSAAATAPGGDARRRAEAGKDLQDSPISIAPDGDAEEDGSSGAGREDQERPAEVVREAADGRKVLTI